MQFILPEQTIMRNRIKRLAEVHIRACLICPCPHQPSWVLLQKIQIKFMKHDLPCIKPYLLKLINPCISKWMYIFSLKILKRTTGSSSSHSKSLCNPHEIPITMMLVRQHSFQGYTCLHRTTSKLNSHLIKLLIISISFFLQKSWIQWLNIWFTP